MNKKELLELEIEKRSLSEVIHQFTTHDCDPRMEVGKDDFLKRIESKIVSIQNKILSKKEEAIAEIANRIWKDEGCPDGDTLIHRHGKIMKLKEVHWELAETEWTYGPDYLR